MFLVLLLVLSLAAVSQQHCHHQNHKRNRIQNLADYHSRVFEEVSNQVIALDKKREQLCEARSNGATKEMFEKNRYVIKIPLQDYTEDEIKVEIRHRVIYINAYEVGASKYYAEVRELPAFVDVHEAKFTFDDGLLQVVFPTKDTLNNSCDPNINDGVIKVPKFELFSGQIAPRFGE